MKSPYTGGEVKLVTERQNIPFKGETFEMEVYTYECIDTGKRFTTGEMDDAFVDELHRLWRERHEMPTIEQLRAVRKQLGLSLREMSKLLGFGINQYRYYEAGELPSGSNLLLLRLLVNKVTMPHIVAMQSKLLPSKTIKALEKWIKGENASVLVIHTPVINRTTFIKHTKEESSTTKFEYKEDNRFDAVSSFPYLEASNSCLI